MEQTMFCNQCQQTAGAGGCSGKAGVCGKTWEIAAVQDQITGALMALARVARNKAETETDKIITEGLFATVTNVNFDESALKETLAKIHTEKDRLFKKYHPAQKDTAMTEDYDIHALWRDDIDIRSLKSLILYGLRGMAAYAYHAMVLGYTDLGVFRFLREGLVILTENRPQRELIDCAMELGKVNLACMELLDKANTESYGHPSPQTVPLTIEPGPFIVVTGHDLLDLEKLLQQTEGKGINIYTHGEMLPAHAYPALKKYPHLKGNFGTAWQNQRKEFDNIPAPVLYTTNCLTPQKPSYADRIFTTGPVYWPNVPHIGEDKDFSPLIAKALELGGYKEPQALTGINGGKQVTTGFGHKAILDAAETVVSAVKEGKLRHIFLVGGCDGIHKGRSYYTEFVKQTPKDTLVLTLACGKFRFNDLDLGTVAGLPRLLDMGQCNDAYGAIRVASTLADVFGCGVNDLPLTLILSWYEQKAVCILLSLLSLGIKNIYLGPTLPAFISPNVLQFLVENFDIHAISTPEEDLKKILG
ncbi:MAG TPA: hydroxylamine reductase [Clostridiales bacterium]|nr:hydroxylamine reductase [Clostridiales bacterium]